MSNFSYLQNNFTAGELSPRVYARSDLDKHRNGLKTMQNMLVQPQGGAMSRTGTAMVMAAGDHSNSVILKKFQPSVDDTYMLEFGPTYISVYKDGAIVTETADNVTAITKANPGVVTAGAHGFSNGDRVIIESVEGMTEVNSSTTYYIVANVTATTFELTDMDGNNVDTSSYTTYTTGGTAKKIVEVTTPYAASELRELHFSQSVDVLYITHSNHAPRTLTRTNDTTWTLTALQKDTNATGATLAFIGGPYLAGNLTSTTLDPSATSGSVTVVASSTTGINNDTGFQTTDIGRLIRYNDGTEYFYLEITARASTTSVTATVVQNEDRDATTMAGHAATTTWALGSWSDTTGWPYTNVFYQGRHVYGGTDTQQDTLWFSKTDDFVDFIPLTTDDAAISATFSSVEYNPIIWMSSHKELRVGTLGGEHIVRSASNSTALTPTSIEQYQETNYGAKLRIQSESLGSSTLFVQRTGKRIRQFGYNDSIGGFQAVNLALLNQDITKDGIVDISYQREPDPVIWQVRSDGVLLGLTFIPEQNVLGWHRHVLGGTDTAVQAVEVEPTSSQDRVWVSVSRTINGNTRQYIEYISNEFIRTDLNDAKFSDSHLVISKNAPAATLTPSASTGTNVLFTAGSGIFTSADEGKIIEINSGKATIATFSSSTEVYCDITTDLSSTTAASSGAWFLSTNSVTGLEHLEGESVTILTDGGVHPNETVTSGAITLDYQALDIIVGLSYTQVLESLDIDFGSSKGTAYANRARIHGMVFDFYETTGGKLGTSSSDAKELIFREGSSTPGEGVPLTTGTKVVRFRQGWSQRNKWYFEQSDPLPVTILGVALTGEVSEST